MRMLTVYACAAPVWDKLRTQPYTPNDTHAQDRTNENTIDDMEFYDGIRTLFGYRGSKWVIDALFASIDTDHSGEISYDEMFEFLRGIPAGLKRHTHIMCTCTHIHTHTHLYTRMHTHAHACTHVPTQEDPMRLTYVDGSLWSSKRASSHH